ncbi:type II toxin-antitoxin system RelE/ParE family toxin [Pseudomonas yamanorum]|uniref:Toxin n=1 Tax=Pseudomonas yamanorum TaxID=515393 RepID=A0A7Y8F947_9PSED|nr:type II toxin-antitoxin system RelE/ParE family toxin [Pseudomonas yamanorum]NWE43227.1 type II toxin-antitoxin system RelE/ParE family toxin [Pseudomonas yamanorum]NWE74760.1 type II toxin-antitoxin system RelE/ParE family toxin [Pseudomonas yamanorum]
MAEYRLTPAAERDLEGIWVYTARQWDVDQANRYIDILTTTFSDLAQHPKTAPACDHIRLGYRRRSIEQHMIYFRITTYGVSIIRILHDRMDAPRKL